MALRRKLAVSGTGIVVGVILIAVAFAYFVTEQGSGYGHGTTGEDSLTSVGWISITIGVMLIILSLIYLAIPTKVAETRSVAKLYPDLAVITIKGKEALRSDIPSETASPPDEEPSVSFEQMALRLLEGDERRVYRKVVEAGGEILQKDIVSEVPFSKAKVSRIIDKLEERGLISKERHGYTNKIVLAKTQ
ncbi:MAG: hypothetical protein KAW84_03635 [Thermoplasmata archaeon]|nr:hypothetical protein [Thermoplasmata archaeon]